MTKSIFFAVTEPLLFRKLSFSDTCIQGIRQVQKLDRRLSGGGCREEELLNRRPSRRLSSFPIENCAWDDRRGRDCPLAVEKRPVPGSRRGGASTREKQRRTRSRTVVCVYMRVPHSIMSQRFCAWSRRYADGGNE